MVDEADATLQASVASRRRAAGMRLPRGSTQVVESAGACHVKARVRRIGLATGDRADDGVGVLGLEQLEAPRDTISPDAMRVAGPAHPPAIAGAA